MSKLIQCDACRKTGLDDSTSKGAFHEVWIDKETQMHVCDDCYMNILEKYFPPFYEHELNIREE